MTIFVITPLSSSASLSNHPHLESRRYGKRLMFGSDRMVWPEASGMAVESVESATFLTEEQKRDIFHDSAVRFLRLDKK